MAFHPRPQPHRLGPYNGDADNSLPQMTNDADEMLQILFEDLQSLDAKVDANAASVAGSLAAIGGSGSRGPQGVDGPDGEDSGPCTPPGAAITIPVPTQGSVLFGGPSGAIAQDNAHLFWDDANDRLGVGTIVPQRTIHVVGPDGAVASFPTVSAANTLVLENNGSSNLAFVGNAASDCSIGWFASGVATPNARIIYSFGSDAVIFRLSGGEKMRITTDGKVGIGTGSPATLLDVSSTAPSFQMTDTTASAKSLRVVVDANVANLYEAAGTAGDILSLDLTNKRVGIGTASPSNVVSVSTPNSATTSVQGQMAGINDSLTSTFEIGVSEASVAPGSRAAIQFIKDAAAATSIEIAFKTFNGVGGTGERIRIDKSGNVGIGTSGPSTLLHVSGGFIRVNTDFGIQFGGTSEAITGTLGTSTIEFTTAGTARMKLVGANFSPSSTGATNLGTPSLVWGNLFVTNIAVSTAATPTAKVHIAAGSTAASSAPIKLTSGTVMTTAEAGAIEFTTDDFFATITTGAARKAFVLDNGTRLTSGKIPIATTNGRLIDLTASSAYTPTNVTTDRSYDANATTLDEVADVLGTVIADLQAKGILG